MTEQDKKVRNAKEQGMNEQSVRAEFEGTGHEGSGYEGAEYMKQNMREQGMQNQDMKEQGVKNQNMREQSAMEQNVKGPIAKDQEKMINAESLNLDASLEEVSRKLKPGETLVLDVGNNYFQQTDKIFDSLVMKGLHVTKAFRNGRNQILVRMPEDKHIH